MKLFILLLVLEMLFWSQQIDDECVFELVCMQVNINSGNNYTYLLSSADEDKAQTSLFLYKLLIITTDYSCYGWNNLSFLKT